jgi:hypothetical protein
VEDAGTVDQYSSSQPLRQACKAHRIHQIYRLLEMLPDSIAGFDKLAGDPAITVEN